MAKSLYIIDGHYQIYRSFYAPLPTVNLSSPSGEPTQATYLFCQILFRLLRDRKPDYLAMAMDVSDETTFRRELDPQYKANREPPPESLHVQVDRIVSIVTTLGIPIYRVPGFEADDLMATMAHKLRDEDIEVYLVSVDKDLEQLISDKVRLYDARTGEVLYPETLMEKKGYAPQQAIEIQTLTGDTTDNIPGVYGVGPLKAIDLIKKYGSAGDVLNSADKLTPKMRERVKAFADQLPLTRQLVTLRRDVPVEFALDECSADRLNFSALRPIFDELAFTRLWEQLNTLTTEPTKTPKSATAIAAGPAGRGEHHLVDTPEQLDALAAKLASQSSFAFDTETTGLNPVAADLVGLSFSWKAGDAYYIPVRAAMGSVLPVDVVVSKLGPILENPSIAKVGQNIKYDILVLRQVGIEVAGITFDTMIASFLLDPLARSHSLDSLAKALLGHEMIPITDLIGKGKNQITIDQVDTRRVCEYAAEDADFTWRLMEVLSRQMTGSHVEPLFRDTEMPLVEVLAEMEHNGIALDTKLLSDLGDSMSGRLIELQYTVQQTAGHQFNIDSTKQLAVVLFDEQGLGVVKKTKTGRSTDHETLETLAARSENPIPRLVLEYRELAKLKRTYIETLPKMVCPRTGRVHASFDQIGTVTGRLSSSDPNLQNIPVRTETGRQIRDAFVVADPDSVLLSADYSQIELRLLAHFCQDAALVEAFRSGEDIHRTVAAEVNGVLLVDVTPTQRSAAKAVNFGIIYGQSAFGLARSLGIPVSDARRFIDTYFKRYPGIRSFIDDCIARAKRTGYAETILGRRRPIQELQSRNRQQVSFGERIAVNTVVQGSAADLIKRAMIDIHRAYKAGEHPARMLIQVHDELVFEVPKRHLDDTAALIREKMAGAIELDVPVVVDIASGRTWAEAK